MVRKLYPTSSRMAFKTLALMAVLWPQIVNATYTPITISSGYNVDVVANGTGAANTKTTAPFDNDANEYALMTLGYNNGTAASTVGLPASGLLNSVSTPGLSYQFADFDQNNALQINTTSGSGTLTFATPVGAGEIYLLGSAGNGPATITVTVNFVSGTPQTFTGVTVGDWYGGSSFAIMGLGRVARVTNNIDNNASDPRLYDIKLALSAANWNNPIASITITRTSTGGRVNIMGVSINDVCSGNPVGGTTVMTPGIVCPNTSFTLSTTGSSNSTGLSYQWESSPVGANTWTAISSATNATYTVAAGVSASTDYRLAITCAIGSGVGNSSVYTVTPASTLPGGTYTINPASPTGGTNFQNFTDAVAAIKCGIGGPIVFDVTNATYNEQIDIPAITGASATNTITFNGHGATLSYLISASGSNYATLNLDGADYITFKHLTFSALGGTYGFAAHLMNNADNNTFDSCSFVASGSSTVTTSGCVSLSNSKTSYTSAGANGSNNTFSNCNTTGGYFGFYFYGSSSSPNAGNKIINCRVQDFYYNGIYYYYQTGGQISRNTIERPTRASVSTFYGLYLSTGCNNNLVEKNTLRQPSGMTLNTSLTAYVLYVSAAASAGNENKIYNNLIYDMNHTGSSYGIYMSGGTHVKVYHNTVVMDNLNASSGTVYGIYSTGTAGVDLKNNLVAITRGGTGTKYCLYFSGAGKTSNYNNLYINSPAGSNNIGYLSSAFATLANWQTANSNAYDQNSMDLDPLFASPSTGDYTPTNSLIDNMGTVVGVADDITGATRSATTPDFGAIEFSVPVCTGTPVAGTATVAGNITSACLGGSVNLSLSGFTIGSGISIEWEESPSGAGIWTPITGATSNSYTAVLAGATDYRAKVTCVNGGGLDVSNTITINTNPFYLCYCSPNTGVTLHTASSNYITNVTILNSTLNSATSAVGNGGYTLQDYTVAANTTTLTQGWTYTLNASISSATYGTELWIDWDQNGAFDTAEYLLLAPGAISTVTFQVPANAVPGLTGMRLRTISSATVKYANTGACSSLTNTSETEDYVITVAPGLQCSGIPALGGNITASNSSICNGNTIAMSLNNFPQDLGLSFQWESSPAGQNNFTPIAGETGFNYTSAALNADIDYRVAVTCNNAGGGTGYSDTLNVLVNNPQITSSTGATICGVGTATLTAATVPGNSINWYTNATGGVPVATNTSSFITPILTNTTTYYAAAGNGSQTQVSPMPATLPNVSTTTYAGLVIDVNQNLILNTVDVFSINGGTVSVELRNSAGTIIAGPVSFPLVASTYTTPQTLPVNFQIPVGTGYRLLATPSASLAYQGGTYPLPLGNNVGNIVNGAVGSGTSTSTLNYYFYNLQTTTGCEGSRVPVVATVNPAPAYTISASPDTICVGSSSTVSVSSANNYTYTWTPSGSGNSFTVSPSTTTKYYVNGVDGSNCTMYDSVTVAVKSAPANATVSASPEAICVTGSTTVTINPAPMYGIDITWEKNTGSGYTVIPGATGTTYTEPVSTTTYYRANFYCNSTLITTSATDTAVYSNPTIAQTIPGSRCGTGPVTLAAIGANGAAINWYANATGGTALATGNAFTTPSISATTTYYAAASEGGSSANVGRIAPVSGAGTVLSTYGQDFTITQSITLNSVDVISTTGTSITISLYNSTGATQLQTTGALTVPTNTTTTVNLNWQLAPGTYRIAANAMTGNFIRENSNVTYPIALGSVGQVNGFVSSITGSVSTTASYYWFYNWLISTGCESVRVPVTATINPAASGTGLATGGTTVGTSQVANSTQSYTDACNDTVAVVASGNTALGTTSAIVLTSASVPTHQNKPFVPRAYDINPATDGPATVTLYALQSEFNAYNSYVTSNSLSLPLLPTGPSDLTGMGNIVITQYHGSASAGTQGPLGLYSSANVDFIQNSSITVTPVGNYWKLTFPVTGFSGFFIHTGANPLAIDLKNISAVNMGNRNRVDWTTGTEQSGDRFELERSADGTNFRKLAEITAKGQPSGYSYWDETPVTGVNYYRLKMVDASGKGTYSKVVTATVKSGNFTVEAYPNPVKDVLTVKVFGVQGKDATVSITDITGKVIRTITMSSDKTTLEMSGLAQGMYLIKYADSDNSQTIKVNKQ